jgi:3-deoxy-manno-octulosonate cytidylyltransferase (CMP-KDO synthetase)
MTTLIHKASGKEVRDENIVKAVFDHNHFALYFSRSLIPVYRTGSREETYWKHLGFYAYTYSFLKKFTALPPAKLEKIEKLEQLRALEFGYNIKVVETEFDTVSVDTAGDLNKVRRLFMT